MLKSKIYNVAISLFLCIYFLIAQFRTFYLLHAVLSTGGIMAVYPLWLATCLVVCIVLFINYVIKLVKLVGDIF